MRRLAGTVAAAIVLVGKGRTEISLDATAPAATARIVSAAERRLARTLAARART